MQLANIHWTLLFGFCRGLSWKFNCSSSSLNMHAQTLVIADGRRRGLGCLSTRHCFDCITRHTELMMLCELCSICPFQTNWIEFACTHTHGHWFWLWTSRWTAVQHLSTVQTNRICVCLPKDRMPILSWFSLLSPPFLFWITAIAFVHSRTVCAYIGFLFLFSRFCHTAKCVCVPVTVNIDITQWKLLFMLCIRPGPALIPFHS